MTLIGARHDTRHQCDDQHHLPNCYNPHSDVTACACGDTWWRGRVGTWHSRHIREQVTVTDHHGTYTRPGAVVAYDRYFLHAADCAESGPDAEPGHLCRETPALSAHEFWGRPACLGHDEEVS